jgi:DNA-binding transcriptional MerR regulator
MDGGTLSQLDASPSRNGKERTHRAYDPELLEALRRIAALQREAVSQNAVLNALVLRATALEGALAESAARCERVERSFADQIEREIEHVAAHNRELEAAIATIRASGWWRLKLAIARIGSTFYRRRSTAKS